MPHRTKKDPNLGRRIEQILREDFGGNKSAMARAVGLDPESGTVHNWLRRNTGMDPHYAFILQDKFGWDARWILEGVGRPRIVRLDPEGEKIVAAVKDLSPARRRALAELLGL